MKRINIFKNRHIAFLTWTILVFTYSCDNKKSKQTDKDLIHVSILDTVAQIYFPNLLSLDTTYTWTDYSDTDCSSYLKIRYQNKKDSSYKETGFFKRTRPPQYKTYLTFQTEGYIKCINKLDPYKFEEYANKFGDNLIENEIRNGWKIKKITDYIFTNTNGLKIFITGYFIKVRQNEFKIFFSALTFNPKNNIPIQIDIEKTFKKYDSLFITNTFETLNKLGIK